MNRREGIRLVTAAAFGALPGCGSVAAPPPPPDEDTFVIPGPAIDHLRSHARSGYACWQGGNTVSYLGSNRDFPVLSITKPVAALAAVRAITEGWLGADEAVGFTEWNARSSPGRPCVRQLVNSTAGIATGNKQLYTDKPADKGAAAVALPVEHAPGAMFCYGPAPWELLAELLRRRLKERDTTLQRWFRKHVAEVGIRPGNWRLDGLKTPYFSTGMECGFDDLGRLGACLCRLLRGESSAGLDAAAFLNLCSPRAANPMFSAGIWWNRAAGSKGARVIEPERSIKDDRGPAFWHRACLEPTAHRGWIALVGSGGSRVYVLPRSSVVVAVALAGKRWSDAAMLKALVAGSAT